MIRAALERGGRRIHRRERWRPGRAFEKDSKRKRPQVKLSNPVRRNEAKFLNDYMEARGAGVHRRNGGDPGVRLKKTTKGKSRNG